MKTGDDMKMTQEFMEAIHKELKRTGVVIELESGEGKFDIQGVGSDTITITMTIRSHAVLSFGNQKER